MRSQLDRKELEDEMERVESDCEAYFPIFMVNKSVLTVRKT